MRDGCGWCQVRDSIVDQYLLFLNVNIGSDNGKILLSKGSICGEGLIDIQWNVVIL